MPRPGRRPGLYGQKAGLGRSGPRMLPDHKYPIPQREPLIWIIRYRRIHRRVPNCNTSRRCNHPPDVLIRLVPHLDPEGEVARDVVEVWIS
jgi:hypothetical protein